MLTVSDDFKIYFVKICDWSVVLHGISANSGILCLLVAENV